MKNNLSISILIIIIILGSNDSFSQSTKELKFFSLTSKIRNEKIEVYLKVDTAQKQYEEGLKFSVRIKNHSKDSIILRNILEYCNMTLFNDSGVNIIIPHIPKALFDSQEPYSFSSFIVENVVVNGEPVNENLAQKYFIIIPAKGNYEVFLKIRKVVKTYNGKLVKGEKSLLPYGNYRLLVTQGIVEDNKVETLSAGMLLISYIECR